jgi:hypothetical protein
MNTTGMNSEVRDGSLALVTFRVRAEKLGYGETVYLYPDDSPGKVRYVMNITMILRLISRYYQYNLCASQ